MAELGRGQPVILNRASVTPTDIMGSSGISISGGWELMSNVG
jgi:hypothetical protein